MTRVGLLACWLALAIGSLPATSARAGEPAREDAFLDGPFPADFPWETFTYPPEGFAGPKQSYQMLGVSSFWKGVELLGAMSGKKALLPADLVEWPDERSERNWQGMGLGAANKQTVRKLFESLCLRLGVVWSYDAKADVIRLEPEWRRADPRPDKELVNVLLDTPPVDWAKLLQGAADRADAVGHADATNHPVGGGILRDAWRLAFDALLSRSENFPVGGVVRLYYDTHDNGPRALTPLVINLFTGRMLDADGNRRIVVLNKQFQMTSKDDPGDVACYVFDEAGRLLRGSVSALEEGWVGGIGGVQANDREVTLAVAQGNHSLDPDSFHFALAEDGLVLQGSTSSKGEQRNAAETRTAFHSAHGDCVRLIYSIRAK